MSAFGIETSTIGVVDEKATVAACRLKGANTVENSDPKTAPLSKTSGNPEKQVASPDRCTEIGIRNRLLWVAATKHTSELGSSKSSRIEELIAEGTVTGTRDVNPRHTKSVKRKIVAMKTLANQ